MRHESFFHLRAASSHDTAPASAKAGDRHGNRVGQVCGEWTDPCGASVATHTRTRTRGRANQTYCTLSHKHTHTLSSDHHAGPLAVSSAGGLSGLTVRGGTRAEDGGQGRPLHSLVSWEGLAPSSGDGPLSSLTCCSRRPAPLKGGLFLLVACG